MRYYVTKMKQVFKDWQTFLAPSRVSSTLSVFQSNANRRHDGIIMVQKNFNVPKFKIQTLDSMQFCTFNLTLLYSNIITNHKIYTRLLVANNGLVLLKILYLIY